MRIISNSFDDIGCNRPKEMFGHLKEGILQLISYLLDIKALINFCIVKKYNRRTWAPDEFFELLLFVGSLQPLGGYRLGRDLQFDTLISSYEEYNF